MKVKELIQKLGQFDEDCQIELYYQAFLLKSLRLDILILKEYVLKKEHMMML